MKLSHLVLSLTTLLAATMAQALDVKPYTPAALAQAQATGQATALHFHADWCPTCKKQTQSIETLKADKTLKITVFVADYDLEESLKKQLKVRTQSTLIIYKSNEEKVRLVGKTSPEDIKTALSSAL